MNKTALLLSTILYSASAFAVEPLLENIYARNLQSLNGEWATIVDPTGTQKWGTKAGRQNYPLDISFYDDESVLIEYDFNRAQKLSVPGDWNSQKAEFLYYEGAMWYRQRFNAESKEGRRYFVYFGAAYYESRTFLNGKELGVHKGGFTPFNYEVTDIIRNGSNSLVVRVDNTRHKGDVPTTDFDWWNYGGITRDVMIVSVPETFVRDYKLALSADGSTIDGYIQLDGSKAGESNVKIEIPALKSCIKTKTGADGRAEFSLKTPKKLQCWCPETPVLYDVTLSCDSDIVADRIGFKTIKVEGSKVLLNGKPVFLKGVAIHDETISDNPGRVRNAAQAKGLLDAAKEMNCNFVRLSHYPHSEAMVRQAEEMGLMVWDEIPCYWNIDWTNSETLAVDLQQLEEMISRDKNRAGVIVWSVANETPRGPERLAFLTKAISHARELDPTRLVSAALLPKSVDKEKNIRTLEDELSPYVDILCFNIYIGWYNGMPDLAEKTSWVFDTDKPVMITEFGGGCLQGHHGRKDQRFTEEYLVWIYEENLKMFDKIPQLVGLDPWILKDFRSPKRPVAGIQDFYNRKGLISECGKKKDAFYVMQNYYKNK